MDVSSIVFNLEQERFAHLQQVKQLSRALKALRKLRGKSVAVDDTSAKDSAFAERSRRMKRAWKTRRANQKHKLQIMRSKRAA